MRNKRALVPVMLTSVLACGGASLPGSDAEDASMDDSSAEGSSDAGEQDGTVGDGGGTDAHEGADAGDSSMTDGGPLDGAFVSPVCPPYPPTAGSACAPKGVSCEYGAFTDGLCNVVWSCGSNAEWYELYTGSFCDARDGGNDPTCPSTYAQAADAGACSPSAGTCEYPEGRCACVSWCGGPPPIDGGAPPRWVCDKPYGAGCPAVRPRIGSGCSGGPMYCGYDICCGGTEMACTDAGYWQGSVMAGGCP
jgi:hypothetical protein